MRDSELEKITAAVHTGAELAFSTNIQSMVRRLSASDSGVKLRGAAWRGFHLVNGSAVAPGQLFTAEPCRVMGFMAAETTGSAPATLSFFDSDHGSDPTKLVGVVTLGAGQSARDFWGPHGVGLSEGLYVAVTGTIAGSVFLTPGV